MTIFGLLFKASNSYSLQVHYFYLDTIPIYLISGTGEKGVTHTIYKNNNKKNNKKQKQKKLKNKSTNKHHGLSIV